MVGLGRLELPTSRLSGVRSNQAELQARIDHKNASHVITIITIKRDGLRPNLIAVFFHTGARNGLALERDAKTAVHLGAMVVMKVCVSIFER